MTEAGMPAGSAGRSTPFGAGGALANILRGFAAMSAAAAKLFRPSRLKLAQPEAESASAETEASETQAAAVTAPLAADVHVEGGGLERTTVTYVVPDQQEIDRRRNLVRLFFNDFWDGASDKPPAFVERLDAAEEYLNERLAANGESWRVDAKTRLVLGLPPHASGSAKRTS